MTVMGASEDEIPPRALRAGAPAIGPDDRWWVQLLFHQRAAVTARDDSAFALVDGVMRESMGLAAPGTDHPGPWFSPDDHRETVVEITTPLDVDDQKNMFAAITRGLDALRDADRASILASDAPRTPIAPTDVWPVVPFVRRNRSDWTLIGQPNIIVLEGSQLRDRPVEDELDDEAMLRVESALGAIQARHPFTRWQEWLAAAQEARLAARPEDAVVRLAVAVEVMLDAVLALALWETGATPEDAAQPLKKDLGRRIRQDFGSVLGGSWDRTRGPVAAWSQDLTYLRGRVVHRGHRPSSEEMQAAFEAADQLHIHVIDRVVARRSQIPRTALLLLGRGGLEERDALDGAVQKLGADGGLTTDDWLLTYDRWRAEVDQLVRDA